MLFILPVTVCLIQVTTQLYLDQNIAQLEIRIVVAQTYCHDNVYSFNNILIMGNKQLVIVNYAGDIETVEQE